MDDLTATQQTWVVPPAAVLEGRWQRREALREAFAARVAVWQARLGRAVMPGDRVEVAKLGVPCLDCLQVVREQEEDGHRILFGVMFGPGWAQGVQATCGRAGS